MKRIRQMIAPALVALCAGCGGEPAPISTTESEEAQAKAKSHQMEQQKAQQDQMKKMMESQARESGGRKPK